MTAIPLTVSTSASLSFMGKEICVTVTSNARHARVGGHSHTLQWRQMSVIPLCDHPTHDQNFWHHTPQCCHPTRSHVELAVCAPLPCVTVTSNVRHARVGGHSHTHRGGDARLG